MKRRYIVVGDRALLSDEIVGIFDLDKTTVKKDTREFLNKNQQKDRIETVGNDIPLSFIATARPKRTAFLKNKDDTGVILSPVSPITLGQRAKNG